MFNAGVEALLEALPGLANLDRSHVRRVLAGAWLDVVRYRDFAHVEGVATGADLRRLATALEVRLFLGGALPDEARHASAFVAAEALGIVRELNPPVDEPESVAFGSVRRFELVEEGLLYLIAGYDANAALTARELDTGAPSVDPEISAWALARIRALLDHTRPAPNDEAPQASSDASLRDRIRHEVWRRIGSSVGAHVRWLRLLEDKDPKVGLALGALAHDLHEPDRPAASAYPDLHHLCRLLASACEETDARALRRVAPPIADEERFLEYQRGRARRMPLLWPAAAEYAAKALPGPLSHAVVTVPTGAGKSAVAELAAAQAVGRGWVLYLAPTNALVAQIRRDLTRSLGALGVRIRGLTGGAEYTQMSSETLDSLADREIAVMTPEKCSLALRQNPEAFESLSLCVMDEAHLIGDEHSRGVVAELVLAEVLHRSRDVRVLLLSALIENPDRLAGWLTAATGTDAVAIDAPWRPTRTLRALCGLDAERAVDLAAEARDRFRYLPSNRKNVRVDLPLRLLGALHGTWTGEDPADYEIVDTGLTVPTDVDRHGRISKTGHTAPTTRALTQALAAAGHRVLVFLPGDRHAPFSHARALDGPGRRLPRRPNEADSLLTLADAELAGVEGGRSSELHDALDRGLALHTSAMLVEEQRASELTFEAGAATVMLATGTLAQGLNLPATAVVIGGTAVGDRREANTAAGKARAKAQLLNAIGRAGRAQTAARSLAIVVPNQPVYIGTAPAVAVARDAAGFLAEEDGSTEVTSRLDGLIAATLSNSLDLETMGVPEQTAFAFLSFTAESGDATAVLRRSLAAHTGGAADRAEQVTDALRTLGRQFLERESAGAWIATAAHRAGITLPVAVALERELRAILTERRPVDVGEWAATLVDALAAMPNEIRPGLLADENLASTAVAVVGSNDPEEQRSGWKALARTIDAWLAGRPLTEVGAALHARDAPIDTRRAKGAEMPRTLRFVGNAIEHDMTTLAGAAVAIVQTGVESHSDGPWALDVPSAQALVRLPLAMRAGAANPAALALIQAGLRPRIAAHLVARLTSPSVGEDEDVLQFWAELILDELERREFIERYAQTAAQRKVLAAVANMRSVT